MKRLMLYILAAALALVAVASSDIKEAKAIGRTQSQAVATVRVPGAYQLVKKGPACRTQSRNMLLRREFGYSDFTAMRPTPARLAEEVPEIVGFVMSLDSWMGTRDRNIGLYKLPRTGTGNPNLIYSVEEHIPADGDISTYLEYDGKIYASCVVSDLWGYEQTYSMLIFDAATGELLSTEPATYNEYMINAAIDPETGTIYAVTGCPFYDYYGETHYKYGTITINGNTVEFHPIKSFDYYPKVMIFDNAGDLYMFLPAKDGTSSNENAAMIVKLTKDTGDFSQVGALPVQAEYRSGAVVDRTTGRCFWNASGMYTTSLYEVDLANATCSKLFDYSCGLSAVGLKIAAPPASGTPGRVENLTVSFPEASLSGVISFDIPAVEGASTVEYVVKVDEVEVARKRCDAPSHVDVDYTAAAPGQHMFAVNLVNGELVGPTANTSMFIGHGTPNAPIVSAVWADGVMTVSWEPVTTTADGGYIDPTSVTYKVVCDNDHSVIAESTSKTSVTTKVAMPENLIRYSYTVTAIYAGKSASGKSNMVSVGYVPIPYNNGFDTQDDWDQITVIDANKDAKTWTFENGYSRYTYSSENDADDWLMTPPVCVEAGKAYKISFTAHGSSNSYPERLEVKYGSSTAISAMTGTILEPTILPTTRENGKYEIVYIPKATSPFVLGFHAISDKDMMKLMLDDISIEYGPSLSSPGVPTDIVVTPDPDGELKVNISVKAPVTDLADAPLSGNVDLYITRGTTVIKQQNVTPGATVTVEDVLTEQGEVTYSFYATNAAGASSTETATVFVGVKKPMAPTDITMTEQGNSGYVTISWPAVDTDIDGGTINSSKVRYNIYSINAGRPEIIQEGVTATSYSLQAVNADSQDFAQYALSAVTDGGESDIVATRALAVGKPYEEMTESFANGRLNHIFLIKKLTSAEMSWSLYYDNGIQGIASQDKDNGYAASVADYIDAAGALETGKLLIPSDIDNPALSFYTYNITDENQQADANLIEISVAEAGSNEFTTIYSRSVNEICQGQPGWGKALASLTAYKGKTVVVRIAAVVKAFKYTAIDNLKIENMTGHDLSIISISAPETVMIGNGYTVDVNVVNEGANPAEQYSVELYADNELVDIKECSDLPVATTEVVSFARTMHQLAEQPVSYHAVVVYANDAVSDNNSSKNVIVYPRQSVLPAVTDLTAKRTADGALLSWNEPDISQGVYETVTEDVEAGEAWAHSLDGWTFVDGDDFAVGGFQNISIPGITIGETKASFFVFNGTETGNNTFRAHSGDQYLASMFRSDDGTVDDWAISPMLSGNAQTISFYVCSYSSQYPEKIEVLASSTGKQTTDFAVVREATTVGGNWELVKVSLPAGTRYFAIRSVATGSFMLMLDDITFEKSYPADHLMIMGYNIWRNGEKINTEPIGKCSFTDAEAPDGKVTYVVTTVYNSGESSGSNAAILDMSSLDRISANISVYTDGRNIVINGARGKLVRVNTVDGLTLHSATAGDIASIPVASGVYLVTVDRQTTKVFVR